MTVRDTVLRTIEKTKLIPVPVGETSDLYADLGFDSLSFVSLLVELEKIYEITFGISEIEDCLEVCNLIRIIEGKVGERE